MIDNYQIIRELGEGATGSVFLAEKNNERVALKVLNQNHKNYLKLHENMIKEKEVLERLDHPNIMRILEAKLDVSWEIDGQQMRGDYIASEVVPNGELFDFIDSSYGRFSEPVAKHLFV